MTISFGKKMLFLYHKVAIASKFVLYDDTTQCVQLLNHITTILEQSILTVNVLQVHSINSHNYNDISKNVNKSNTNIKTHLVSDMA